MAWVHAVPRQFQRAVTLERPAAGERCDDCRMEVLPPRPVVVFRGQRLCLTCGRGEGLVVKVRRTDPA
jgi:hypothetical protein